MAGVLAIHSLDGGEGEMMGILHTVGVCVFALLVGTWVGLMVGLFVKALSKSERSERMALVEATYEMLMRDCPEFRDAVAAFDAGNELKLARKALLRARTIIQSGRDALVECHSVSQSKDATDFDPAIAGDVAEMDSALASIDEAIAATSHLETAD